MIGDPPAAAGERRASAPASPPSGAPYGAHEPSQRVQRVLNESWPLLGPTGPHAHGIPDQPNRVEVEVRLDLERDGERWVAGRAARWTRTHVYVVDLAGAPRRHTTVWVRAGDVRRRPTDGQEA